MQSYEGIGTWPSVNRVTLVGIVGQIRKNSYQNSGSKFLDIFLATRSLKRGLSGALITAPEWHHLVLYGEAEVNKFVAKVRERDFLLIEGHLQYKDDTQEKRPSRLKNVQRYADVLIDYWNWLGTTRPSESAPPIIEGSVKVVAPQIDVHSFDGVRDERIEERVTKQEYRPESG